MRSQRRGALAIAGAERARDRGRHAAAHRAARHRHGQDHAGKHQRHRGERLDAEPADIGGLRNDDAGAGGERDDVGPGEPQQRAQDRPVQQRILHRRLRRRKRALLLVYGDFGNADIGHFCSRAARSGGCAAGCPSMAGADSTCAKRIGGLRDCRRAARPYPIDQMNGGLPSRRRLQMHGDMAAASGGEALEQTLQHFGAGRADNRRHPAISFQRLLADLERACGFADLDRHRPAIRTARAGTPTNSFAPPRLDDERARDLVEILHADQLAREMQQIAGILGAEHLHHHGRGGLHIFHRVVAIGLFQPRLWPARRPASAGAVAGSNSGASRWRANTSRWSSSSGWSYS